jgi:S-DNA-T family DNA segregation ATPase FtsK/SpoIIIE
MSLGVREDVRSFIMSHTGQEIPLAIISTVEAIWAESKRPQLHEKRKTQNGWEFKFALPPGMSYRDFANREEYFRDSIGDITTSMQHIGKLALLKVVEKKIPKKVVFSFDHIPCMSDMILPMLIGYNHEGAVYADLAKVYNILIGGYIGGGKSNIIHVITNTLLHLQQPPKIVMVDLKVVEYDYLSKRVLLATEQLTARMALTRIVVEMRNRLQILLQAKCVNIEKYNERYGGMDYIVLIIDELAELKDKQAQEDLETLLRLGRAPGIRIILATQRPDCEIFGKKSFGACKANLVGRLCFQVSDSINSKIILDSTEAASLPKIPGRAIWKLGESIEVQTPYLDPDIAEVYLEQPSKMFNQRRADSIDDSRMGSNVDGSNLPTIISVIRGLSKKIIKIDGKETD